MRYVYLIIFKSPFMKYSEKEFMNFIFIKVDMLYEKHNIVSLILTARRKSTKLFLILLANLSFHFRKQPVYTYEYLHCNFACFMTI